MSVQGALCPPHHKLLIEHREDYPACLQCEINWLNEQLRDIVEVINSLSPTHREILRPELDEIKRLARGE